MSDLITDGMVESAARAIDQAYNPERHPILAAMFRDYARAALNAAAPMIAAATLRDAARRELAAWDSICMSSDWDDAVVDVCDSLRARADRIEKEADCG